MFEAFTPITISPSIFFYFFRQKRLHLYTYCGDWSWKRCSRTSIRSGANLALMDCQTLFFWRKIHDSIIHTCHWYIKNWSIVLWHIANRFVLKGYNKLLQSKFEIGVLHGLVAFGIRIDEFGLDCFLPTVADSRRWGFRDWKAIVLLNVLDDRTVGRLLPFLTSASINKATSCGESCPLESRWHGAL